MLDMSRPTLIVQRSFQRNGQLDDCLAQLTKDSAGDVLVGASVGLTWYQPDSVRKKLRATGSELRMADPQLFTHSDTPHKERARSGDYAFMRDPIPESPDTQWADAVLSEQRAAGATALLSPGFWVPATDGARELQSAFQWVGVAREVAGEELLLVDFSLAADWLSNDLLRRRLLNEIVESNERAFHLRFYWPVVAPSYGQLRDPRILQGLVEIAHVCASEGKSLILPNSGLSGWLMTAIGATGFSTGTSARERAFAEQRVIRMPKGAPRRDPVPRYFDPMLLHTVDLETHLAMVTHPDYVRCDCRYCQDLGIGDADLDASTWDAEKAGYHYLVQCQRLAKLLAASNRRSVALALVRSALEFVASLPATAKPTGDGRPQHLPVWETLLT